MTLSKADWRGLDGDTMRRRVLAEARRRGLTVTTRLQENALRVTSAGRNRTYPWDTWLDGEMHALQPGVDFLVDVEVMREQARRAARLRGRGLRSKMFRGSLWVQALDPG